MPPTLRKRHGGRGIEKGCSCYVHTSWVNRCYLSVGYRNSLLPDAPGTVVLIPFYLPLQTLFLPSLGEKGCKPFSSVRNSVIPQHFIMTKIQNVQTGLCVCTTGAVLEGHGILGSETSTGVEGIEHVHTSSSCLYPLPHCPNYSVKHSACIGSQMTQAEPMLSCHAFFPMVGQQKPLLLYFVCIRYFVTEVKKASNIPLKALASSLSIQSTGSFMSPAPVTVRSWFTAKHTVCLRRLFSLAWIYFVTAHW